MVTSVGVIHSAPAVAARTCHVAVQQKQQQQQQPQSHGTLAGVKTDVRGPSRRGISFRHVFWAEEGVRSAEYGGREGGSRYHSISERKRAVAGIRRGRSVRLCARYAIASWVGRTHLGASPSCSSWQQLLELAKLVEDATIREGRRAVGKRRRGGRGQGGGGALSVEASVFGVGAPEALVIGVVALLVFGPKGLAEVARNLGKTLRTFQPTIQELRQVSSEFKNALEQEIGWDDIRNPNLPPAAGSVPPPPPPPPHETDAMTGERTAADTRPTSGGMAGGGGGVAGKQGVMSVTEEMRAESERAAWRRSPPSSAEDQDDPRN